MKMTIAEARRNLGQLCARAQDPRERILLTRHGEPMAAIVSIDEAKRIWQSQNGQESASGATTVQPAKDIQSTDAVATTTKEGHAGQVDKTTPPPARRRPRWRFWQRRMAGE
jgi:prevent-host-death family protein